MLDEVASDQVALHVRTSVLARAAMAGQLKGGVDGVKTALKRHGKLVLPYLSWEEDLRESVREQREEWQKAFGNLDDVAVVRQLKDLERGLTQASVAGRDAAREASRQKVEQQRKLEQAGKSRLAAWGVRK